LRLLLAACFIPGNNSQSKLALFEIASWLPNFRP
jgi:hypothetical protein